MRSLRTLSLVLLTALSFSVSPAADAQAGAVFGSGAAAGAPTRPTSPDGARYDVPRALVEDYVVCAVEARALRAERAPGAELVASLERETATLAAEVDALRDAVAGCELAGRIEEGRGAAARSGVAAALERAVSAETRLGRAERSWLRWRTFALTFPLIATSAGFVAGVVLVR